MTPKEKAKELFDKYFDMKWQSYRKSTSSIKSMTKQAAKQCALIAVNEMIIQNGELYLLGFAKDYYTEKNAYLFDIKAELQSL